MSVFSYKLEKKLHRLSLNNWTVVSSISGNAWIDAVVEFVAYAYYSNHTPFHPYTKDYVSSCPQWMIDYIYGICLLWLVDDNFVFSTQKYDGRKWWKSHWLTRLYDSIALLMFEMANA